MYIYQRDKYIYFPLTLSFFLLKALTAITISRLPAHRTDEARIDERCKFEIVCWNQIRQKRLYHS